MYTEKIWRLARQAPPKFLRQYANLDHLVAQLLYNRHLQNKNAIKKFLDPDYRTGLYDPFLVRGMSRACDRIFLAIQKKEKIIIYGDYDADGITSTVLLYKTLKFLGAKYLETYIPHRQKEGYGLNKKSVQKFKKQKTNLIVTVDCGISNLSQVALARKLNIDVIICDHHQIPAKLPAAFAILNVRRKGDLYPFKDLAGVGIAFKLAQALLQKDKNHTALTKEAFEKWLLDLVAIGTVADLCPLLDENRVLVKYGLIILNQTKRIGLKKILAMARLQPKTSLLDTHSIGYQIAPRLNAAGRLLHANAAFQLLLTESEREAEKLAEDLEQTNRQRQKLTLDILNEAQEQIGEFGNKKILLASHPSWSAGIAGLVAGKICDQYGRPTLIIERGKKESRGSARSIEAFNITEALAQCGQLLIRYGGHKTAAGFTLYTHQINLFYQKLEKLAQQKIKSADLKPKIEIDAWLDPGKSNWTIFEQIEKFQPFGEGNAVPKFLAENLSIVQIQSVGAGSKHLKIKLQNQEQKNFDAIGFNLGHWIYKLIPGDKIDIVYELIMDEWNGHKKLQLKIIDLKVKNQELKN